jgi:hypothetical protein
MAGLAGVDAGVGEVEGERVEGGEEVAAEGAFVLVGEGVLRGLEDGDVLQST